jgi:hypothetical protein
MLRRQQRFLRTGELPAKNGRAAPRKSFYVVSALIDSEEARFPGSESLKRTKRFVSLKLMERNQNTETY